MAKFTLNQLADKLEAVTKKVRDFLVEKEAYMLGGDLVAVSDLLVEQIRNNGRDPKLTRITFWTNGDRSVGINGDQITIELDFSGFDDADKAEQIAFAKEELGKAFGQIWDTGKVHAMTEEELDSLEEK